MAKIADLYLPVVEDIEKVLDVCLSKLDELNPEDKGFDAAVRANDMLLKHTEESDKIENDWERNCAYVDGSYNPDTKYFGYGMVFYDSHGTLIRMNDSEYDFANMHNVAGEIEAVIHALSLAKEIGMDTITIYYDYEGIRSWPDGLWQAKNYCTQYYTNVVNNLRDEGMTIIFEHVKAHSGNPGNEEADRLAREAVTN